MSLILSADTPAVLKKAAKTCTFTKLKTTDEIATKVTTLNAKIEAGKTHLASLFGFEKAHAKELGKALSKLRAERHALENIGKYQDYGLLDLDVLSWRDKKTGYPQLALFNLDDAVFGMSVEITNTYDSYGTYRKSYQKISPNVPSQLRHYYHDVLSLLHEAAKEEEKTAHLTIEYSGVIPSEDRATIIAAQKEFKEIFLLAEASNWQLSYSKPKEVRLPPPDPLICGWDGENLWVIGAFDLTTVEALVKAEFTV